jgi:HK97 family phage major capsid protein/HK97 family phage prohead protease
MKYLGMEKKLSVPKKQTRAVSTDIKLSEDGETMEFSFSSEVPYERYFGFEIISHEKGAMNLERLLAAAPLLFNHDMDKQIGVIDDAWIGDDRRGYVRVRFSKSAFAQEKLQDIKDKILVGVSFGYMVEDMVPTKTGSNGEPNTYTVTKCLPYEVSCVTVPADYSVGIERSVAGSEDLEIIIPKNSEELAVEARAEEEKTLAALAAQQARKSMEVNDAVKGERERIATIQALGSKLGKSDLAKSLIENGKSLDEARAAFLDSIGMVQKPVNGNEGEVGMSENEKKEFSFVRAMNALANPNDAKAQKAAGFELELSRAAAEKSGREVRGIMIPVDILRHFRRDLTVGTATAGGHTVATDLLAGSFIDLLRKKSVVQRAGAQVLNGLNGNIAIPRQTGAATAYWVAESGAPTESAMAFDQVAMSPKTLGAFSDISRKLLIQSSVDVESMVRNDLASVLALELDRCALYGSGSSNQPTGLVGITGLNIVDLAAATPTFAEMVAMETAIASDNADIGVMKYLINAAGRGALKTKEKASGYPQYVLENGLINGYGHECSNQIAAGDFFFGNWADLIIGMWSGLDLTLDPITGATSGTVRIIALQDCDIAARHGESFARAYEVP